MSTLLGPGGQALSSAPKPAAAPVGDGSIPETTARTFAKDVLEPSRRTIVVVDFWSPRVPDIQNHSRTLERVAQAFSGSVLLVRMNVDEHPEIAGQLGIRSIPAVIAFRQGQPMDGFVGLQTDAQVRAFLERVAGPATDGVVELIAEADAARAAGEHEKALTLYSEVLGRDEVNAQAIAGLGLVSVAEGNLEAAKEILGQLPPELLKEPPIQALSAAVALAEQAAALGGPAELKARVETDPNDFGARLDLAVALAAHGDRDGAVAELIEVMRRDREWNDGAARQQLIRFFEAWGPTDPATLTGRRKMASVLFA